ncbi:MAG: hypothetical protein HQK55_14510, partial [Deltaproteobacteria bacterium]|nr:hypothetical protein [Deltaproteobacteria bacterium]
MKTRIFLALSVIFLLTVGAMSALAETRVEFTGHLRLRYFDYHNYNPWAPAGAGGPKAESKASQVTYFDSRFQIEPNFIVSDNLAFRMRIRALTGNRWGHQGYPLDYRAWDAPTPMNNTSSFELTAAYVEWKNNWGGVASIGRQITGFYGLGSLRYIGSRFAKAADVFLAVVPYDAELPKNRIAYTQNAPWTSGHLSITLAYEKVAEVDDANAGRQLGLPPQTAGYDDDWDLFQLTPQVSWETGVGNGVANFMVQYD